MKFTLETDPPAQIVVSWMPTPDGDTMYQIIHVSPSAASPPDHWTLAELRELQILLTCLDVAVNSYRAQKAQAEIPF